MQFYCLVLVTCQASKYLELKRPVYHSFLYLAQHTALNFYYVCYEVQKIKTSCKPNKWTLWRINLDSFNNTLPRFSETSKPNRNPVLIMHLLRFNSCRSLCKTCITNQFCSSLVFLVFCTWLVYWTYLPTPGPDLY